MKTINSIKLTDDQLRQIVARATARPRRQGGAGCDSASFCVAAGRHDRRPAVNDDFPSSVTEVLICAAILGLSSVLAAFLFFALIS
jgi:hypothetical protein